MLLNDCLNESVRKENNETKYKHKKVLRKHIKLENGKISLVAEYSGSS